MHSRVRLSLLPGALLLLGLATTSPEQAYRTAIARENAEYAQGTHALLKIQDAVYLAPGESAVLAGVAGQATSWHWQPAGEGALRVTLTADGPQVLAGVRPVAAAQLAAGVPVDAGIEVTGQPTQVAAGVVGWRFFVFNPRTPALAEFAGVQYFPFDAGAIVRARFTPDPRRTPHDFATSRGTTKRFFHVGDARFTRLGTSVTLPFYADGDGARLTGMSAFFTDELSGRGAYAAGRYLDVPLAGVPPAQLTLDFNQAYNPLCARSPHFTCPIARDHIDVALAAGERDPHAP